MSSEQKALLSKAFFSSFFLEDFRLCGIFCFGFGICIFVYIHIIYYIVSVIHKQLEEGDHKDLRKLILENRSQLVPIEMGIVST